MSDNDVKGTLLQAQRDCSIVAPSFTSMIANHNQLHNALNMTHII